jgi:hypothetical protein
MNVTSYSSASTSTSSTTSLYNPSTSESIPTLTSSSESSLPTFNMFDGFNNLISSSSGNLNGSVGGSGGGGNNNSGGSSHLLATQPPTSTGTQFTNALFNTNPSPSSIQSMQQQQHPHTHPHHTLSHTHTPLTSTNIVTDETVAQIVSNTSVPEFLYQLTKMLTDDHRDIIEWSNGKIEVHNPTKLEKEVLNQYFRHSKYASFQRQLNYFGFRKLAGKGKMAPCSYVNENATSDLRSLLRMKRKTSATTKDGKSTSNNNDTNNNDGSSTTNGKGHARSTSNKKSSSNKRSRTNRQSQHHLMTHSNVHQLSSPNGTAGPSSSITIAKGAGVKHQLNGYLAGNRTGINIGSTNSSQYQSSSNSSTSQIIPINNPLVPDPMISLDPSAIAKAAVGKGVTHQFHSSTLTQPTNGTITNNSSTNGNVNVNNVPSNSTNNGIGACNNIINGIPMDSSNKLTFLDPSQLGMGIENCLSELQTNFRNSLNEANAKDNTTNDHGGNCNNNGALNQQQLQHLSMQRESSLVDLAIIPSLSSILPPSVGNAENGSESNNLSLTPTMTMNNKISLEADYGMTFIDFPTGGIDPSTLPPPEN